MAAAFSRRSAASRGLALLTNDTLGLLTELVELNLAEVLKRKSAMQVESKCGQTVSNCGSVLLQRVRQLEYRGLYQALRDWEAQGRGHERRSHERTKAPERRGQLVGSNRGGPGRRV